MGNRDIFSAALALPEAERLKLASDLISSVDGPDEPGWENAWGEEVERRERREHGASSAGASANEAGEPWSRVRGRVLQRLPSR